MKPWEVYAIALLAAFFVVTGRATNGLRLFQQISGGK